jgi:hypothetical protein
VQTNRDNPHLEGGVRAQGVQEQRPLSVSTSISGTSRRGEDAISRGEENREANDTWASWEELSPPSVRRPRLSDDLWDWRSDEGGSGPESASTMGDDVATSSEEDISWGTRVGRLFNDSRRTLSYAGGVSYTIIDRS